MISHPVFWPMHSRAPVRFPAAGLLGAVLILAGGCGKPTTAVVPPQPISVAVAPVAYSTDPIPVQATGLLARKAEVQLSFKIGGIVDAVFVRAGDAVVQGQALARLRLDEIDAQVAQARSALAKARRDLGRIERLAADRVATTENLQDARTAVELAEAQLRIAEFNRAYAVIAAPASGRILARLAEPNEMVAVGHGILRFASDAEGWIVRVNLPEREAARVALGDRARVTPDLPAASAVDGQVTQISEAADPETRTTPMEVALCAVPAQARSGSVAAVAITPRPVAERPVVPVSALIEGEDHRAGLYLVDPLARRVRRVEVAVEAIAGERAYLRTALPRAGQVVVGGGEYVHDGDPVDWTAEAAAGGP